MPETVLRNAGYNGHSPYLRTSRYEHPHQETNLGAPGTTGSHLSSLQGISNETKDCLTDDD